MADANIRAVITAEDKASDTLRKFSNGVSSLAKDVAIGVGVAGAAVVAFGVMSVKAFTESQDAMAQTEAVIKSTGGVAKVTATQVTDLATALQKNSIYADENIQSAANLLLTFTNISDKVFPETTQAVLDMSTAMKQDLRTTALQVGKALQSPVEGVTALQRVGVRLSDSQKDVIKSLVATGKTVEAQKIILKELQVEFGGSALAARKTFGGALQGLKNDLNNVQEGIGKTISEGLTPFINKISVFISSEKFTKWLEGLIKQLSEFLPKAFNWLNNVGIPFMKAAFDALWPVVQIAWNIFSGLIKFLVDNQWVLVTIASLFIGIKTAMFLTGAYNAFVGVMAAVKLSYLATSAFISATPFIMPALAIGAAIASIALVYNKYKETKAVIEETTNAVAKNQAGVDASIAQLKGLLYTSNDPAVRARAAKALHGMNVPGYAVGTNFSTGGMALVGEQGPEIVNLPRGSQVIPNNKIGSTGSNINVTFSGIFTGSEMEFRKLAVKVFKSYEDAKGMGTL